MANQTDFTKMFADMPNMMDTKAFEDGFKTAAEFNEKLAGVMFDSASKATDVVAGSAKEAFGNVRTLTAARSEPTAYGQVFSDFVQAQMQVGQRTTEALAEIAQSAGGEFTGIAQKAGEETAGKAATAAKTATKAA
ncbi:phasin family protein [Salipiger mucosus]|uniref:Phasin, PhaP n=1 Tax=Salipiger mucosus DSM 16094 TaxID=1123237 RepID=S9QWA4_9RHOB|nr:phasin family protein [Salipiger mucosus]EPX83898.1 phasin, PhaP [Salipiger mucosus DSM 16094]